MDQPSGPSGSHTPGVTAQHLQIRPTDTIPASVGRQIYAYKIEELTGEQLRELGREDHLHHRGGSLTGEQLRELGREDHLHHRGGSLTP